MVDSILKSQEETIEKTIETSDFLSGGLLNPTQQRTFVVLLKRFSVLLSRVRTIQMPTPQMEIDKLHVSEPITESIDENTSTANTAKPKINQVTLQARKLKSGWNITTETLQGNIERDGFEQTVINTMTSRIATDLEMLAIQGDTSISPAATDPESVLLRRLDGWHVQSQSAHVLDIGGANMQHGIFSEMKRTMPRQFRNDPGMRFIMSDSLITDWQDVLSDRETDLGDRSIERGGTGLRPYGIEIVRVQLIPDDLPVTVSSGASPGEVDGVRAEPYTFVTGSNDTLLLTISGVPVTVTFPQGTLDGVEVYSAINSAIVTAGAAGIAFDNGENKLRIRTTATGAGASVVVGTLGAGSTANSTLGFPDAGVTGTGAAASGTLNEGSFVWLANPRNFIWGILDGTRIFTEFNKDFDRIETIVYNQVDAKIENLNALVLGENVRRKSMIV